ncbi:hypothetical protein L9F63_003873 [Diploptera punctata]|uniref:Uncharacterized protein n=1 Tax=Diploptera punctata TaxID=6984 RepID=A0AAD8E9N2_DIPPU|nr:hypothetical protein L9F63_003873 [Diploptera punctata]
MLIRISLCLWVLMVIVECTTPPIIGDDSNTKFLNKRSLSGRLGCNLGDSNPSGRSNTTEQLARLRDEMINANITAYIVTTNDEHQSEYVADRDRRRQYVSGFTGSSGNAVVTLTKAALWTDSRYYLQADQQLDCNWILMRSGVSGVPTIQEFIVEELKPGDVVSADPKIITWKDWTTWDTVFSKAGLELKLHTENLVDNIWGENEGRPSYPDVALFPLSTEYAGKAWQLKLDEIRQVMTENSANVLVLSALDEVAWVLNVRGGDIPHTPVFKAYLVIEINYNATLYVSSDKVTSEIENHLNAHKHHRGDSVIIKEYDEIWDDLANLDVGDNKIWLPDAYSYAGGVSYLIYKITNEGNVLLKTSPALLMKNIKNEVESKGMRNAHIKDAVALCQFLNKIENEVTWDPSKEQKEWDELTAESHLDSLRKQQALSLGPSFDTISAFGPNSALPHYSATPDTNRVIDNSSLFMLDSGGQYLDGTTDVTRTVHYGTPTEEQITIYTHLLMGCINLVTTVFPEGQTLQTLEIMIRAPLYSLGRNYGHGSTHGIGSCLAVHEAFNTTYHEGFFGSQEPGYYEENAYGMRLENIVTVIKADVEFRSLSSSSTFNIRLAPKKASLIKHIDTQKELTLNWLNNYHTKVREVVGTEMLEQGLQDTYEWLLQKTDPIS